MGLLGESEVPQPAVRRPAGPPAGLRPGAPLRPGVAWLWRGEGAHGGTSPGRIAAQQVLERGPPRRLPHRTVSAAGAGPAGSL